MTDRENVNSNLKKDSLNKRKGNKEKTDVRMREGTVCLSTFLRKTNVFRSAYISPRRNLKPDLKIMTTKNT